MPAGQRIFSVKCLKSENAQTIVPKIKNTRLIFFPKYSDAMRIKINQSFVYPDIYNLEIDRPGKTRKEQDLLHIASLIQMCSLIS